MQRLPRHILYGFIGLAFWSCQQDPGPDPVCFDRDPLRAWTINGVDTELGDSFEPNAGLNLDFLFSLSLDGSFAIDFTSEPYYLSWSEPQQKLFSGDELSTLSEEEWKAELDRRTPYSFGFQPFVNNRRELWITEENGDLLILGDDLDEFTTGTIDMSLDRQGDCEYLVLTIDLQFLNGLDTFNIHLEVDDVYDWIE